MLSFKIVCISTILCVLCSVSLAQEPATGNKSPSLEEIERKQSRDNLETLYDEVKLSAEKFSQNKKYNCIKAFGDENFCECLISKLAMGLSFKDYIMIVTSSKEEINYQQLSEEDRKMADTVYSAREFCVQKKGK